MKPKLFTLAASVVVAVVAVGALACGGGDTKEVQSTATQPPRPAAAASVAPATGVSGSCGEGNSASKLTAIKRSGQRAFSAAPQRMIDPASIYTAVIQTSKGEIRTELAARDVTNTTNNFVFLACDGYYDGLTFHRVEPGFVIQGGDPKADGTGGPGYAIPLEISPNWRHGLGALAMARSSDPNSAGSQFYITLAPQASLNDKYTVFGKVTSGMEVVQQIRVGDKILRIDIIEQ